MSWFDVKQTGAWPKVNMLMRDRHARIEAQKVKILRDFIKKFRKVVVDGIPAEPRLAPYKNSIVARKIVGAFNVRDKEFAYALVAKEQKMKLAELDTESDVLYVLPTEEPTNPLGTLLIEHSPWSMRMIGIKRLQHIDGIKFVHRTVSSDEVEKIYQKNLKIVETNSFDFKAAHASLDDKDEPVAPESVSDLAFYVMRLEFGIKVSPSPHWGRAARKSQTIIREMMKKEDGYSRYLNEVNFTQWKKPEKKLKLITLKRFMKRYQAFQDKVNLS